MKIYTKFGDKMQTSTAKGLVYKDDELVGLVGDIDELISYLTSAYAFALNEEVKEQLNKLALNFMDISSIIGGFSDKKISEDITTEMENKIDYFQSMLQPIHNFILLGNKKNSSFINISRTVCRRIERNYVKSIRSDKVDSNKEILSFVNRASDLLFVLTRVEDEVGNNHDY